MIKQRLRTVLDWRFRNTFFLILSLLILFFIADSNFVLYLIRRIGEWGYLGAFFVGIFFVSVFTVAPSVLVIYYLAGYLSPWEVAIFAGLGAVIGDLIIFKFIKNSLFSEWSWLLKSRHKIKIEKIFSTPYFSWLLPIFGALIIISPFPDEFGISLMGLSRIKQWQFALICFFLNAFGIFIIVSLANIK